MTPAGRHSALSGGTTPTGDQTALFVLLAACSATILAATLLAPGRRERPAMAAATVGYLVLQPGLVC